MRRADASLLGICLLTLGGCQLMPDNGVPGLSAGTPEPAGTTGDTLDPGDDETTSMPSPSTGEGEVESSESGFVPDPTNPTSGGDDEGTTSDDSTGGDSSGGTETGPGSCDQPLLLGPNFPVIFDAMVAASTNSFTRAGCAGSVPDAVGTFTAPAAGTYEFTMLEASNLMTVAVLDASCDGQVLVCDTLTESDDHQWTVALAAGQSVVVIVTPYYSLYDEDSAARVLIDQL